MKEDTDFFLNLAVIGATLFGLTLVALGSFLPKVIERFEASALAAFPHAENSNRPLPKSRVYSMTDLEMLDGDPLVFFIAYSMGVPWNLFCLPMIVGFTAAWSKAYPAIFLIEFFVFTLFIDRSLSGRASSITRLGVYLTNEEPYWPQITRVVIYALKSATALLAVGTLTSLLAWVSIWREMHIAGLLKEINWVLLQYLPGFLKLICVLSLLLGTYILNKDVFIFFKAITLENTRKEWLARFREDYNGLSVEVNSALSSTSGAMKDRQNLKNTWNEGIPRLASNHLLLKGEDDEQHRRALWLEIRDGRRGAPTWLLSVPEIASWEADVRQKLDDFRLESTVKPPSASVGLDDSGPGTAWNA